MRFSKGEINRAGERLCGRRPATPTELEAARECVRYYRGLHSYPLTKVTMGVRQMVRTATGAEAPVAQRLKRFPQIVHKLRRKPEMNLARMGDIGGCRVLLPDEEALRALCAHLRRQWNVPDNRVNDYITAPQATGYRGVHLYTLRDERQIEVQLRTLGQHSWAENVERIALVTGWPLKDGDGPEDVLEFYRLASEAIAVQEAGGNPGEELLKDLARLRVRVIKMIQESQR